MIIGDRQFKDYTYVMAIINLTPDSFWADSRTSADNALFAAQRAIDEGAAILDLGAQSTRPGYNQVSADEERLRLERPLEQIKREFDIPVSVDTYFPEVAAMALDMGADMINDVRGLKSEGMAEAIARHRASVCIMHNSDVPLSGDVFAPVMAFLRAQCRHAVGAGIDAQKICVDGGIGFAKDREQNIQLLNGYSALGELGYPLLLGCSRKSLFGGRVEDRLKPTLAATYRAAQQGVLFVRVHDVKPNVEEIKRAYGN